MTHLFLDEVTVIAQEHNTVDINNFPIADKAAGPETSWWTYKGTVAPGAVGRTIDYVMI